MKHVRDGPLGKLWFSKFLGLIFFRPWHEYFLGLIGVHEFFLFNFPLRVYFFLYFAPTPTPISSLMVRP